MALLKKSPSYCDGLARRDLLRVGCASLFGLGLDLPGMLAQQAFAKETHPTKDNGISLIYVFLKGGLSTIDTFDQKPHAPAEFRGDFGSISTALPGVQVCEHLPKVSKQLDKFSLIRSFTHRNSNHGFADHYMLTGYHPIAGFNVGLKPNNQPCARFHHRQETRSTGSRPSLRMFAWIAPQRGSRLSWRPRTLRLSSMRTPAPPNFSVPDLLPPLELDARRIEARQRLLGQVDRYQQTLESQANAGALALNTFRTKAVDLMTSPEAKHAFDLTAEPDKLREQYGMHTLGQSCLMARRLVEAGVRCVTIDHTNWDTHNDNFKVLRNELLPQFDPAISTLFTDLSVRGMLDKTMVIITGEFGRTPRINKDAGRDHWGPAFTVLVGGGGIQGGRVIGTTDARAEKPADNPYGPEDLAATLHHLMGIDPTEEFYTPEGRPVKIVNDGRIIRDLL